MKQYLQERQKRERISLLTGVVLTVGVHVLAAAFLVFNGVKYIWPPPAESSFVLDFSEEDEPVPIVQQRGNQPSAEQVDPTRPIELVQRSESPYEGSSRNLTPESAADPHGDVEVPQPKQEEVLNPRASFPGMSKKDTSLTSPHSAGEASSEFKGGQADGNTANGKVDGTVNAKVKGRNVVGLLPKPAYSVQKSGIVVVEITVDNYGNVTTARAGVEGTTVTDKTLWNEARKAAMETHFNISASAPATQTGTITYTFRLVQ